MPSDPDNQRRLLIEEIRTAAEERVRSSSLRGVAREVGFSPSGLQKFLNGTQPYRPGFRRLHAWYVTQRETPLELSDADAAAALTLLTIGMRKDRRSRATRSMLDALTNGFAEHPPRWLLALRAHFAPAEHAEEM